MRLLVDTHALLWFTSGSGKLGVAARNAIEDPNNEVLLSSASAWEIAVKVSIGKLHLTRPIDVFLYEELRDNSITLLPISLEHILRVSGLPFHHRDPFDRMLIAQSLAEHVPLVSRDVVFDSYGIQRIW